MKRDNSNNSGFTLMETLIAVAIVVILMAVAFIGVINYQRSMKQLELDRTAQEIFIAAQNHLAMAESQGVLAFRAKSIEANVVGEKAERKDAGGTTTVYHYFYVNNTSRSNLLKNGTVLYDMLPLYSIDETVRAGGSYVIEYDLDSATVTNVFYSDQSRFSEVQFKNENDYFKKLFVDPGYIGDGAAGSRLKGFDDASNQIIGWYGGDNAKGLQRTTLYAPQVIIKNAECLEVEVSFKATDLSRMIANMGSDALVQVTIASKTRESTTHIVNRNLSGGSAYGVPVNAFLGGGSKVEGKTVRRYITYILDDVTQPNGHFAEQHWCTEDTEDAHALIPGEDIKVQATVFSNTRLANIAKSNESYTNSLFAEMIDDAGAAPSAQYKKVACISNIRHLENLDASISGYQLHTLGKDGAVKAQQTADLYWKAGGSATSNSFQDAIYNNAARTHPTAETSAAKVQVYPLQASSRFIPSEGDGTFLPVDTHASSSNAYNLQYDGKDKDGKVHNISAVNINTTEPAGVFGTLADVSSIKNLELIDCSVTSTGTGAEAGAGVLAGVAKNGVTITNVLVRDSSGDVKSTVIGKTAGGLIGIVQGSDGKAVTIDSCAAAVLVNGTGENSVAGGLVGTAGANVTIAHSYAGGHTENGMYKTDDFNVRSAGTAGGLIGSSTGAAISNSYSTCSVSGATAGGLVGSATGGSIANCYCTGLVDAQSGAAGRIGAFAGTSTAALTNSFYYKSINYDNNDLGPIGGQANDGVQAIDENVKKYDEYFKNISFVDGVPYDTVLTKLYAGKFPFKAISHLYSSYVNDITKDYFVTKHYGDWPAPEVLVVNEPNA